MSSVKSETLLDLVSADLNRECIGSDTVRVSSARYVCVVDRTETGPAVVVADTESASTTRMQAQADNAVMNPSHKWLAVHARRAVQVFNLESKEKVGSVDVAYDIVHISWASPKYLALVTEKHVYHWNPAGTSSPKKIFERHADVKEATVTGYVADASLSWLMLTLLKDDDSPAGARGVVQLYSTEKKASRVLEGHCGCFVELSLKKETCNVMCVVGNGPEGGRLFAVEMPTGKKQTTTYPKKTSSVPFTSPNERPLGIAETQGLLSVVTSAGNYFMFDLDSLQLAISEPTYTTPVAAVAIDGGFLTVDATGSVKTHHLDVLRIVNDLKASNPSFALSIAGKAGLSEADALYQQHIAVMVSKGELDEAMELALTAPNGCLRTLDTLTLFMGVPQVPGQPPTIMQYFQKIIAADKLNAEESLELAKVVLQRPNGADFLTDLSSKKKLTASEELGNKVLPTDAGLALTFYTQARCHARVLGLLVDKQQFPKALAYIKERTVADEYTPDWKEILTALAAKDATKAKDFAVLLHKDIGEAAVDPDDVAELFLERNCVEQATAYLVAILQGDKEEDSDLQTKLFEMSLLHSSAQSADSLFTQTKYTKFDSKKIADLCERAGLHTRALKLCTKAHIRGEDNLAAIQRCAVAAAGSASTWLKSITGILPPDDALAMIGALINSSTRQNAPVCADAVVHHINRLDRSKVIELFLSHKAYSALFQILAHIMPGNDEEEVHTRYIECAVRSGQVGELERITRVSEHYEPKAVLAILKEARLTDPWPWINVCHKYGLFDEMVRYLIETRNQRYIDLYLCDKAPANTPAVVSALFAERADDEMIVSLLFKVEAAPVAQVIEAAESHDKETVLVPWMQSLANSGSTDGKLLTTLAKHYVDSARHNAKEFMEAHKGQFDAKEVGGYAEGKAPEIALAAFEAGKCDADVLRLSLDRRMHRNLADYLIQRSSLELWNKALASYPDSPQDKQDLVDAILSIAIPKASDPNQVSVAVKAFTQAGMPKQLIAVLEKLVLDDTDSQFASNKYLQNLLLFTVIQAAPSDAMKYIKRMHSFDVDEIASAALKKKLYEEVLQIHKQSNQKDGSCKAMKVVLNEMNDLQRGKEMAASENKPACWKLLGEAQLKKPGMLAEALVSLSKAKDQGLTRAAVRAVKGAGDAKLYVSLVECLRATRDAPHNSDVSFLAFADTELAYALSKCEMHTELSQFLANPNLASLSQAAERCYSEGMYEAARMLFTADHNYPRLASTLLRLKQYLEAFDAAQKAASVKTWKELCFQCVNEGELRIAQMAAQYIIVMPDELDGVLDYFEKTGCVKELQALLKTGLNNERVHQGVYTALAVLNAKYDAGKLMGFLKLYAAKVNRKEVLHVCETQHLWAEARFLHACDENWDAVLKTVLDHPSPAWDHALFMEACSKATVMDHLYSGITFYLEDHPELALEVLRHVASRVNPEKVVLAVHRLGRVDCIKPWLLSVQRVNNKVVNEAINDLFIEEEDYDALRTSLQAHTNYERLSLCEKLGKHPLMEMRRVSSWLHAESGRFQVAIDQAFDDKLYRDATAYAAQSNSSAVVDALLRRFVDAGLFECFAAALYSCYEITQPDVALELAWRHKSPDIVMPYLIQVLKDLWDSRCNCSSHNRLGTPLTKTPRQDFLS